MAAQSAQRRGSRRNRLDEAFDAQLARAALGLPEIIGELHLHPVIGRAAECFDSRSAISAEMPARPLRIADSVLRATPSPSAASVTVRSSALRQSSRMISPG